ncbi:hypothetical protein J7L06_03915 [Candidatus Bathyarchaeota archaeon]|nr:hypothetical protein [Candidatus Bathyarchaeota archaeon]
MYSPGEVLRAVLKARRELGLKSTSEPKIVDTVFHEDSGTLLVIAEDRPDKACILGPGGWVLKRVKDELGVEQIGARAMIDIKVKLERVRLAIRYYSMLARSLENSIKRLILEKVIPVLRNELDYPRRNLYEGDPLGTHQVMVGYSGGVDSTSTLIVLKKAGLNPVAVTVDPGSRILPEKTKEFIRKLAKKIGVPHLFVKPNGETFKRIFEDSVAGRIHPCGSCSREIESMVLHEAKKRGLSLVSFGDLLPTGSHSIQLRSNDRVKMNILAALAYSKIDSILLARSIGHPSPRLTYGCPFLRALHRKHPHFRFISAQRVLREARANILEPNQALQYIKSIFM